MMTYHYETVAPDQLTALDLRAETAALEAAQTSYECARVTVDGHAEAAEIVFVPEAGRIGCAWGAPADWSDADSIEAYLARTFSEDDPAWVWSVTDAAEAWGVSPMRVRQYLRAGRVPGAVPLGQEWAIPAGAPKPQNPHSTR